MRLPLACLLLAALLPAAHAAPLKGVEFTHNDWTLACDNTRTCRAAGYQNEDAGDDPVSVLLTRKGGPDQPITGQLMLGEYEESDLPSTVSLQINGTSLGAVKDSTDFSAAQVSALLKALVKDSRIELIGNNGRRWALSDRGASAVLLKMDEFQGRLGTPGAIMRKGSRAEASVLPALPVPVVTLGKRVPTTAADEALGNVPALRAALAVATSADDCDALHPDQDTQFEREPHPITVKRLDSRRLLVSTVCWTGAYNIGSGYWVVNDRAPYQPRYITNLGADDDTRTITAAHKGRGLGDCWSTAAWAWNGSEYIQTDDANTGLCRLVAAGGAWQMPSLVSEVKEP
ncbi:DUF1176 domain-containing protein [Stenotrophomonas sp. 278]|uniref:DUF1176 domain-containing protein n=1 Tax=Stenotrophomonas sp. 278 TaxID=2479851 RepID=UPI000F65F059|nr:DUF1176 domain-containing protein [Stenotrophomonas sp. 278]RRU02865.1 DUF1176 domain-containing protein [Stenotrophomonas sp. 278]